MGFQKKNSDILGSETKIFQHSFAHMKVGNQISHNVEKKKKMKSIVFPPTGDFKDLFKSLKSPVGEKKFFHFLYFFLQKQELTFFHFIFY